MDLVRSDEESPSLFGRAADLVCRGLWNGTPVSDQRTDALDAASLSSPQVRPEDSILAVFIIVIRFPHGGSVNHSRVKASGVQSTPSSHLTLIHTLRP